MKKILFIILVTNLSYLPNILAGERTPSLLVSNSWKLINTSKGIPVKMYIKEFKVTFLPDGKWVFESELTGKYEGMKMNGSGTWRVKGDILIYTAGDNAGKSLIEINDGILKLNPDPVVMFNGSESVISTYSKDK